MEEETKNSSVEKRSKSKSSERRFRRRRSRSRSRNKRYQRSISRSPSPFRGFRGGNNNRRFGRRSPPFRGGRNFGRDRFRRRSRSSSRRFDRKDDRRRFGRSRSNSPNDRMADNFRGQQQQQQQQMSYQTDPYNSYMQNVVPPQAPSFAPQMNQFGSYDFQTNYPPPAPNFSNISCPAPPGIQGESWIQQNMTMPEESEEDKKKREAAIAEEKKRQREGLKKQRDQYIGRAEKMKRELKVLKDQKSDLLDGLGKRSPSPKTNGFIKENEKLQSQISSKLAEIINVIDMLSGIIKKDSDDEEVSSKKKTKRSRKSESDDSSPERIKTELLESMKRKKQQEAEEKKEKVNYVYYDPEMHWCKHCQVFPKTAKDYLSHLHSKEHLDKIASRSTEGPWRASFQKLNDTPNYPDAPTERVSIKGLQFFEPSTAWFCKLCEMFMGDSWCVSLHLKSEIHAQRYSKLIEREPKFEEKWLEARNKAFELSGTGINNDAGSGNSNDKASSEKGKVSDKKSKKKKNKKDSKKKRKHGKKRKRDTSDSSSDSEEDSASSSSEGSSKKNDSDHTENKNSIRVAMRNILNKGSSVTENDERSGKWTMVPIDSNKPQVPPAPTISVNAAKEIKKDEQIIGQWSTIEPVISQEEKRLLENLKGRLKTNQKQEPEVNEKSQIVEKKESSKSKYDRPRSRSRERNKSDRNYRGRKSRSRSISPRKRSVSPRRRSKSRSKRSRSHSRDRNRYGRRRYSRSRSKSRPKQRYEKSFNFATEPKLPPLKDEKKMPSRSYSSNNNNNKKEDGSSSLANAAKKMPFIGKMPVFKKQMVDKKNEDQLEEKKEEVKAVKEKIVKNKKEEEKNEKWDELMPDPLQFSAIMSQQQQQQQQQAEIVMDECCPPGLDAVLDFEEIPKPISDAPPLKTGPLPKDFQATLDLLFDGDIPKKAVIEMPPVEPPNHEELPIIPPADGPQMIMAEELSQHALLYGSFYNQPSGTAPMPIAAPENMQEESDDKNDSVEMAEEQQVDKFAKNQEDLEDLALLGIDVNDVGSGLW